MLGFTHQFFVVLSQELALVSSITVNIWKSFVTHCHSLLFFIFPVPPNHKSLSVSLIPLSKECCISAIKRCGVLSECVSHRLLYLNISSQDGDAICGVYGTTKRWSLALGSTSLEVGFECLKPHPTWSLFCQLPVWGNIISPVPALALLINFPHHGCSPVEL